MKNLVVCAGFTAILKHVSDHLSNDSDKSRCRTALYRVKNGSISCGLVSKLYNAAYNNNYRLSFIIIDKANIASKECTVIYANSLMQYFLKKYKTEKVLKSHIKSSFSISKESYANIKSFYSSRLQYTHSILKGIKEFISYKNSWYIKNRLNEIFGIEIVPIVIINTNDPISEDDLFKSLDYYVVNTNNPSIDIILNQYFKTKFNSITKPNKYEILEQDSVPLTAENTVVLSSILHQPKDDVEEIKEVEFKEELSFEQAFKNTIRAALYDAVDNIVDDVYDKMIPLINKEINTRVADISAIKLSRAAAELNVILSKLNGVL